MKLLLQSCAVCFIMGGVIGYQMHAHSVRTDLRDLKYYRQTFLSESGWTKMVPGVSNFSIESFDGGKNWYAVDRRVGEPVREPDSSYTGNSELIILGPADKIYPGLLANLSSMDGLISFASKNGPITLSGSNVEEQVKLLQGAGLTVAPSK